MFFDAHAHCVTPGFQGCLVASDLSGWGELVQLAAGNPLALGVHPWVADGIDWSRVQDQLAQFPHQAHGELGLDNTRPHRQAQLDVFEAQLRVATKPLVLHVVRAHAEVLALLKTYDQHKGLVHDFVGSPEEALAYVRQGLYVSFGPRVLRSPKTQRAAERVPMERLLIESDAESVAELARIEGVAEAVARIRGCSVAALLRVTTESGWRLFT